METAHYLSCLWPGLPELWWRGRLSALPAAIAFAIAANFVLVTRFIYPQWLPTSLASMAFWVGVAAWGFLIVRNVKELPEIIAPRLVNEDPDEFPDAHQAYLQGDWPRAESLLNGVLAIEHRDPPALLLLASVYRHTDRLESAEMLMNEVSRLEVADGWALEVIAEQRRLQRAIELATQNDQEENEEAEQTEQDASSRQDDRESVSPHSPTAPSPADLTEEPPLAA